MNRQMHPQNAAQKSAQNYFRKSEQAETLAKQTRKKERSSGVANTARLRGLRLAKEAADKEEADKLAVQTGAPLPSSRSKRPAAARPAKMKRMSY